MKKYVPIANPNLPSSKVYNAVVSDEYPQFIRELERLGIAVFPTEQCCDILPGISRHADMLFQYLGNGEYVIEKSQIKLKSVLDESEFFDCKDVVSLDFNYPDDILLNSCIIGDKVICCKKKHHPILSEKYKLIEVPQGYSKCSVCVVDEHSIITDDESIYSACCNYEIDALIVRKGSVRLNGFDYGFIGGCCGKIAEDTVAFCGNLDSHCDASKIKSFLSERKISCISLGNCGLTDIGSILPLTQIL